jgi:hypothetical protein
MWRFSSNKSACGGVAVTQHSYGALVPQTRPMKIRFKSLRRSTVVVRLAAGELLDTRIGLMSNKMRLVFTLEGQSSPQELVFSSVSFLSFQVFSPATRY